MIDFASGEKVNEESNFVCFEIYELFQIDFDEVNRL